MTTLRDIGVSALINISLVILFLLSFVFLSVQPMNDRVYYPKLYIRGVRKGRPRASPRQLKPIEEYFNLEFGQYMRLFDWAKSALRKNEDDIIQHAGLDSAVFLRIFLVGLKIFVPLLILGMTILIPVNVGAGSLAESGTSNVNANTTDTKFLFSSIDKLSISNVPNGSPRLWAHLVMSYVFTGWVCFILFMEYKSIAALRLKFLSDEKRRPDQFTVMALQIPDKGVQPLSNQVEDYFRTNHPDYYLTHQMAYNATKLSKIVKERDSAQNWLVYFQIKHSRNRAMRPMTKTGFCGVFGEQVDAIDYYTSRIEKSTQEAEAEREVVINNPNATMPAAFVSFKTRWGAAVCAQTQQNQDPTLWLTDWAPEPRDVYWANLSIPYVQIGFRKLAVGAIVFLLVFFYMIPVAGVQSLANLEGLRRSIPALDGFLRKGFVASFVQGFLPGLILKLCFWLLPVIIMLITKLEGHLAISKIERRAAAKYYYFVVVNIFFGSILTGSAFQQLKTFVTSSSFLGFLNTLALSIPQKASFFITYIMVDGWSGPAGEILRLWPLVKYHTKNSLFCRTDRDRLRAASPGTITLDQTLPQLQLYFLMGLVYSVITPLILPFIIIFLAFGFVVYRYQVINVYDPVYESAGAFWPHVHGRIIASLILEHLTLIGLFLVKGPISFVQTTPGRSIKSKILRYVRDSCSSTPFMIALPILTLFFHNYCKKRFEAVFTNYPLENAMEKDTIEKQQEPDLNLSVFLRNAYKHPDFSDEKDGADVEKGQEDEEDIEEDDKAALQDSLPARAEEEFVELDDSEEVDQDSESSPLAFKWGAFNQAAEDGADQGSSLSNPPLPNLSREPSDLGPPLIFTRGFFYGDPGEGAGSTSSRRWGSAGGFLDGELRRDSLGRYHSARSFFDSASSRSNYDGESNALSETDSPRPSAAGTPAIDGDDSSNELARIRSLQRYLQGQLSRESSFIESLRVSDEAARFLRDQMSRAPSSISDTHEAPGLQDRLGSQPSETDSPKSTSTLNSELSFESDTEKAALRELQRFMRAQMSRKNSMAGEPVEDDIDEEALRTAYLQGYLRGQLSRENSSSESSPLTLKRGALYGSDDADGSDEVAYLQSYVKGQLSRGNSGSESGSPLAFRRGALFGNESEDEVGGASPSFTASPGSPLRGSPLRGSSNQRFPRAQTMSTIRETSVLASDAQRGHFSRAKTFNLARYAPSPGSPLSNEGAKSSILEVEIAPAPLAEGTSQPAYSRAKSLGMLREVLYLDSPSFVKPDLKRATTLSTLLKEPQATTGKTSRGQSSKAPSQPSQKLRTSTSLRTSPFTEEKTTDSAREAESEASTSRVNTLGNLVENEPQEQPCTIRQLRTEVPSSGKTVNSRDDDSSSSSSSSTSSSSSSSSSSPSSSSSESSKERERDDDTCNHNSEGHTA